MLVGPARVEHRLGAVRITIILGSPEGEPFDSDVVVVFVPVVPEHRNNPESDAHQRYACTD